MNTTSQDEEGVEGDGEFLSGGLQPHQVDVNAEMSRCGIPSFFTACLPPSVRTALMAASPVTILTLPHQSPRPGDAALLQTISNSGHTAEVEIGSAFRRDLTLRSTEEKAAVVKWSKENLASQRSFLVKYECYDQAMELLHVWGYTCVSKESDAVAAASPTTLADADEILMDQEDELVSRKRRRRRSRRHCDKATGLVKFKNLRRLLANGKALYSKGDHFLLRLTAASSLGNGEGWAVARVHKTFGDEMEAVIEKGGEHIDGTGQKLFDLVWSMNFSVFQRVAEAIQLGVLTDELLKYVPQLVEHWSKLPWTERRTFYVPAADGASSTVVKERVLDSCQEAFLKSVVGPRAPEEKYFPLHLLHGPPGTGKTTTLAKTIARLVTEYPDTRILVCEPTNTAMYAMMEALDATGVFAPPGDSGDKKKRKKIAYWKNSSVGGTDVGPSSAASVPLRCLPSVTRKVWETPASTLKYSVTRHGSFVSPSASGRAHELSQYRVVVCTLCIAGELPCTESARKHKKAEGTARRMNDDVVRMFTHVAVDEAGFATEAQFMQATRFLNWHERCSTAASSSSSTTIPAVLSNLNETVPPTVLMLAGDHKQLGPVVSRFATRGTTMAIPSEIKLSFDAILKATEVPQSQAAAPWSAPEAAAEEERLALLRRAVVHLDYNYRSHASIVALFSHLFYNGRVVAAATAKLKEGTTSPARFAASASTLTVAEIAALHAVPTMWVDVAQGGHEMPHQSRSLQNLHEAQVVADIVQALLLSPRSGGPSGGQERRMYLPSDIGIMTPYAAQKHAIFRTLHSRKGLIQASINQIEVDSVERFQGREKKVMIINTVRAPTAGTMRQTLGFLDCPRRTNVSLSRAKERQIIVGNADFLSANSRNWQATVEYHRTLGTLYSLKK